MPSPPPELNGFTLWAADEPFENHSGPFFMKLQKNGKHLSAFLASDQHMNGGGFLHGGLLMTFADYALFVIAHDELNINNDERGYAVTVSCQTDFLAASSQRGAVFADGEVTRNTKSLIFVRGRIFTKDEEDTILATFSGILKKIKT